MLLTNQKIVKLAACRVSLTARNMLDGPCLAPGVAPIHRFQDITLMMVWLMCRGFLPVYHWQELEVSQHLCLFRPLIPMFFCSTHVPPEST